MFISIYIYKDIFNIIRKWLMQLWKLLSLKICSRQARVPENWWWGSSLKAGWTETSASVQVWRQGRKKKKIKVRQREVPSPSAFFVLFVLFRSSPDWMKPTHLKEGKICFTQSTNSNVNFIQKHPHRYTLKNIWPNIWAPHGPVKVTHKINHQEIPKGLRINDVIPMMTTRTRITIICTPLEPDNLGV